MDEELTYKEGHFHDKYNNWFPKIIIFPNEPEDEY